jgi:hypothetical protein
MAEQKSELNQLTIRGKITGSELYQGKQYTRILTPAKDEFSSPQEFKVCSINPLGEPGSVVEVKCELRGYIREFKTNTGTTGTEAKVFLDVVA